MLLEWILAPIFWLVKNLLSLVPTYELPAGFAGSMDGFFNLLFGASYFLPLSTLSIILGLVLLLYLIKFSISAINWLIAKIPTVN